MATAAVQAEPSGLQNISILLENLNNCLSSTGASLPKATRDVPTDVSIEPPQDGISLLDTKNDLLLSYLQNLVFLIIFQLREISSSKEQGDNHDENSIQREEIVKKLTELRVYLDRGVRPLEGRLKYQVDKVIKAAEDAERAERGAPATTKSKTKKSKKSGGEEESGSDSGSSDSDEDSDEEDEDIDEMAFRPNVSAFSKGVEPQARAERADKQDTGDGIYRPPRIMPTALPTTERKEQRERRPLRSNVIDEFVSAEMSAAPMAEPSIGSTIVAGGRRSKSRKEREHEAERTTYEETNFVRLAKESKKDKAKRGGKESTFGGEEWRGLTEGADRIAKLTRRAKGSGGALERSRKRKLNEDGQRSDGVAVGQIFEKRRKKVDSWKRS
ncbi:small subunit rRNA maturation protein LCP5 [Aspergillus clavatus NRRL 1]|uniref:U3 small nucleolar ribonucleoprotein protein Lcp5, putative n=1 Tax=Aspergillus clavatus (strain ATCC 1007 / CBS 513.65 / DSM 816 / NCTC 3887 / NRRL 1 / QM 1276 / 107) TaxID=344612 RepID=A1CUP5_ASPCL|nr:U3 small nucleolar ribonucleoprotein Lcp5, putative [Aspergillus clavatus NRRL 1]EAW07032.1 U3 small nucleolar ribonucleoprotein protein Lcp5, putative [Aspergillus clavatus NRRL 1]